MGISEEANDYIQKHKKKLIEEFADSEIYKPATRPVSFFMAGSPGAGKTEISKVMIPLMEKAFSEKGLDSFRIVRIDGDEIRSFLPGYNGSNSDLFQKAITSGVAKLFDYAMAKKLNVLVDGTFASEKYALENIERSIRKGRLPYIFYVYQDPLKAWEFTKAREAVEGRKIPMEEFIDKLFKAKENVNKIKEIYQDQVYVDLIIKAYDNKISNYEANISNLDDYIKINYSKATLLKELKKLDKC